MVELIVEKIIKNLIEDGLMRSYLSNRLMPDVLIAYEKAFGNVQELSTERHFLSVICKRLEQADAEQRRTFGIYLHKSEITDATEHRTCLWQIKKWITG